jgi:putative endopeptidase
MSAHDVNAYYSPSYNEIVFPAGILQSPFFSLKQDSASNFGGIGTIIGHEITHGFDDQGCQFDADGNLHNWWTKKDLANYKSKIGIIKKQYSNYKINNKNINGQLTLGENIADFGGVNLSLGAFKRHFNKKYPNKDISKHLEQFFINYANIWKSKSTKETTNLRLLVDPHAPPIFRVNGVVRNMDDFYKVFNVTPTHDLYLEPSKRIKLWTL